MTGLPAAIGSVQSGELTRELGVAAELRGVRSARLVEALQSTGLNPFPPVPHSACVQA